MLFCGFHVGPKAPEVRRLIYKTLFQYQHVTGVNNFSILFIIISLVIDTASHIILCTTILFTETLVAISGPNWTECMNL